MSEPKTVEIRIPNMPTMTGSDTTWARLLKSVKDKAKTGYDWLGDQRYCGKLCDFQQGDIVVTGGSKGSRKHGEKYVQMHVVIDEGYLVTVAWQVDNEWAVKMRNDAHDYLKLSWNERVAKALSEEINYLDDPGYEGNLPLDERKLLMAKHREKLKEFAVPLETIDEDAVNSHPMDTLFCRFDPPYDDRKKAELLFDYIERNGDSAGFFHWLLGKRKMEASDAADLASIPS